MRCGWRGDEQSGAEGEKTPQSRRRVVGDLEKESALPSSLPIVISVLIPFWENFMKFAIFAVTEVKDILNHPAEEDIQLMTPCI